LDREDLSAFWKKVTLMELTAIGSGMKKMALKDFWML
jgi:hypothetical protein